MRSTKQCLLPNTTCPTLTILMLTRMTPWSNRNKSYPNWLKTTCVCETNSKKPRISSETNQTLSDSSRTKTNLSPSTLKTYFSADKWRSLWCLTSRGPTKNPHCPRSDKTLSTTRPTWFRHLWSKSTSQSWKMILWKHRCYRIGLLSLRRNRELIEGKLNGPTRWSESSCDSNKWYHNNPSNLKALSIHNPFCPKCLCNLKCFRPHNHITTPKCPSNNPNSALLHPLTSLPLRARRCSLNEISLPPWLLSLISLQNPLEKYQDSTFQRFNQLPKRLMLDPENQTYYSKICTTKRRNLTKSSKMLQHSRSKSMSPIHSTRIEWGRRGSGRLMLLATFEDRGFNKPLTDTD